MEVGVKRLEHERPGFALVLAGEGGFGELGQGAGGLAIDYRFEQLVEIMEMEVDGRAGNSGGGRDGLDREPVETALGGQWGGHIEQLLVSGGGAPRRAAAWMAWSFVKIAVTVSNGAVT